MSNAAALPAEDPPDLSATCGAAARALAPVTVVAPGAEPAADEVVMVVDDDPAVRRSVIDVLASAAVTAVGCGSVAEALQHQAEASPAVVLVDYRLPDGTGFALARALKERDPQLPVLLMTAHVSTDSAMAAVGQFDAYLRKPVAPPTLIQTVRNALAGRRLAAENGALVDRLTRLNTYQALYDPLTELPNRALLDDRLGQALAGARRNGGAVAVLFVDLDRFKMINDLRGHRVGDKVLQVVAGRLASTRRSTDTVARFGGDEFVIVCPEVPDSAAACRIADAVVDALREPMAIDGVEHRLTASVGIALSRPRVDGAPAGEAAGPADVHGWCEPGGDSPETLLRNADTAMYRAKEAGNGWELFDDTMRQRVRERFEIEEGLRLGIDRDDLFLAYQPLVDLTSGAVVGAEALVRWNRPGYGPVLPGAFLVVAEEAGLMVDIGRWVLDRALTDLAARRDEGGLPAGFRLWVNVSPQQLAVADFAATVETLLQAHGVTPSVLGLEIVEEAVGDLRGAEKVLRSVRDLGVALNLDDFGAGHSNLSRLQDLPITGLKIDRQFVAQLDHPGGGRGRAIVEGLLGLGHGLQLQVVAEGVETPDQAATLRDMGCRLAQGYLFGRPAPVDDLWRPAAVGLG